MHDASWLIAFFDSDSLDRLVHPGLQIWPVTVKGHFPVFLKIQCQSSMGKLHVYNIFITKKLISEMSSAYYGGS